VAGRRAITSPWPSKTAAVQPTGISIRSMTSSKVVTRIGDRSSRFDASIGAHGHRDRNHFSSLTCPNTSPTAGRPVWIARAAAETPCGRDKDGSSLPAAVPEYMQHAAIDIREDQVAAENAFECLRLLMEGRQSVGFSSSRGEPPAG
jgi:hypothetical protein